MLKEHLSFDSLPVTVHQLGEKLDSIERLLIMQSDQKPTMQTDVYFDLSELVKYDPEKRSLNTFYGYTCKRDNGFPFMKRGKKITVLKSDFDLWIKSGRKQTDSEIVEEVDNYLSNKNGLKS